MRSSTMTFLRTLFILVRAGFRLGCSVGPTLRRHAFALWRDSCTYPKHVWAACYFTRTRVSLRVPMAGRSGKSGWSTWNQVRGHTRANSREERKVHQQSRKAKYHLAKVFELGIASGVPLSVALPFGGKPAHGKRNRDSAVAWGNAWLAPSVGGFPVCVSCKVFRIRRKQPPTSSQVQIRTGPDTSITVCVTYTST